MAAYEQVAVQPRLRHANLSSCAVREHIISYRSQVLLTIPETSWSSILYVACSMGIFSLAPATTPRTWRFRCGDGVRTTV